MAGVIDPRGEEPQMDADVSRMGVRRDVLALKRAKTMVKEIKAEATLLELIRAAGLDERELARKPLLGLWKGVTVTDDDIEEAKRQLFGNSSSE